MDSRQQIFHSYAALRDGVRKGERGAQWVALVLHPHVSIDAAAWRRLTTVAAATQAVMVYGDHFLRRDGRLVLHPAIDYQEGSVRDDFDFGSVVLLRGDLVQQFFATCPEADRYTHAGWYALRLYLSRQGVLFHLPEPLYVVEEHSEATATGEGQFEYVNPANRQVQMEMEQACTYHLRERGALVNPKRRLPVALHGEAFPVEASVVVPVRNRERTIRDAVASALRQETLFDYNIIVVDNHSTDGTHGILRSIAQEYEKVKVIVPDRRDLAIGGCWNEAVAAACCGRFAIQLDSDDLYATPKVLQTMVDTFYQQQAAMVIGAYRVCDFHLRTLPPGLITHDEWTDDNGANNALRVNGLGAPRAFFTPLLRQHPFPNTSYGEDYAVALTLSQQYKIARLYDELYLCRRWNDNSDAALTIEQTNRNNFYKDKLRTIALRQRRQQNNANRRDP